jgi:predicted AAA+ superfamily ATPase
MFDDLVRWRNSPRRKPLIIRGVRQVGKTWLIREFGRAAYQDVAYFNFETNRALGERFRQDLDPRRLITELGVIHGAVLHPEKTLIVFDELQACSEAITSLKYFYEAAPEYHIVCAGSLLGIELARPASYPVGKVDLMTLRPMTFQEFLLAAGEDMLVAHISNEVVRPEPLSSLFSDRLLRQLKTYYITGGMPEAVSVWLGSGDVGQLESVQQNILDLYELDFAKYAPAHDIPKLGLIWRSIPSQLAKESGKFVYGLLREGARARGYEDAMMWLESAGLAHRVHRIEKPSVPLKAYAKDSYFKLYAADVGLLRKMAGLSARAIVEEGPLYQEFKGVMAECFCLQELVALLGEAPFYWASGNQAEVDFVCTVDDMVVPVEVKAATNPKARSLAEYRKRYQPPVAVKASQLGLNYSDGLLTCPLYLLWRLPRLVSSLHPVSG